MLVLDLRRPVLAADRAARTRVPRLLGARATTRISPEAAARAEPARARPLRRAGLGLRRGRSEGRPEHLRARHPDARHLLRDAADGAGPRRASRADRRLGVRQDRASRPRRARSSRTCRPEQVGWMSHRDSVTAPPEGARVVASSPSTPIAAFEDPERRPLRRPVPPRGRAHAVRQRPAEELPLHGRRRAADLDGRRRDRGAGRAHPGPGRERARALRALRRRRLRGRGAPRLQGDRRPADLRLRRPRPAAEGRGGAGRRDVPQPLPRPARARRRGGAVPRAADGRHRPRGQAARDRRGVHPRLRGGVGEARHRSSTSSRARSTRT